MKTVISRLLQACALSRILDLNDVIAGFVVECGRTNVFWLELCTSELEVDSDSKTSQQGQHLHGRKQRKAQPQAQLTSQVGQQACPLGRQSRQRTEHTTLKETLGSVCQSLCQNILKVMASHRLGGVVVRQSSLER